METRYIPGMKVEIRDAEWRIDRVDVPTHGGMLLTCTGHSELVRGRSAMFLTELEGEINVLSPETTTLVDDTSNGYIATQLYIDTVLKGTAPSDNKIHIGHKAAMDLLPYQLDPALQALKQTRPRILIADTVGLGKTLGAGILTSELIHRGRGKRILVLAVKSMLAQFQREFWQRFTIPLVRLDSVGLQRMRNNIPSNHNPFHYFDRAIISIDTLKQNLEYRDYLENTHWDIVIIDEAHNVAKRSNNSLRHRLATLLAPKCEALLMLSATPHDGNAESFASLINMLDPTAIANVKDYTRDDYSGKGLVIRRLKTDVAEQLVTSLPERIVVRKSVPASEKEDTAFRVVRDSTFKTLNAGSAGAGQLFRTTLEKALLSSPQACVSTIDNRLKRLASKKASADKDHDVAELERLRIHCDGIVPSDFAKFQLLIDMLTPKTDESIGWDIKQDSDRIVLFTESIVSLNFLQEHLPKALKLKKKQSAVLHGSMLDVELADTVNEFNKPSSPLRILLCSDVASEGLNLHHCSHRLIHFDLPWSLMVFQQRNGRVDRYGQTEKPEIYYLSADANDERIKKDQRVLDILIEKDEQASKNLGDPSEFMGGKSIEEQEAFTAAAIEAEDGIVDSKASFDFSALLAASMGKAEQSLALSDVRKKPTAHADLPDVIANNAEIFDSTKGFAEAALKWLQTTRSDLHWSSANGVIDLVAPSDLQQIAKRLPREAIPEDYRFFLTDDVERIQEDMRLARDDETATFGKLQFLWPHHPVVSWLTQAVQDGFGRHSAPVMRLANTLATDEHWFLMHGGFPNKRGQALIQEHVAVHFKDDSVIDLMPLSQLIHKLDLNGSALAHRGEARDCQTLELYLQDAVAFMRGYLQQQKGDIEGELNEMLLAEMTALQILRDEHIQQMELSFSPDAVASKAGTKRAEKADAIDRVFSNYQHWLEETCQTESEPYIQVIAVITGDPGEALAVEDAL